MGICNFRYMNPNLSLLGAKWSQHALLSGFEVKQTNASHLAELRQSQYFCVAILDGKMGVGYKVDLPGICTKQI